MERRGFLKNASVVAAAAAVPVGVSAQSPAAQETAPETAPATAPAQGTSHGPWAQPPETFDQNGMKYRVLGMTGERVSLIGLGGFHLARPNGPSAQEATNLVRSAIDAGVNFCDNCWDYNGGESEIRLGNALAEGYRQRAFLMSKIDGRTAQAAMRQLETSLKRLRTDHIDLLQFHEVIRMDDPERIFARGGALEAVLRAKEQGKVRHVGFTGHKSPTIHKHMFDVAEQHGFRFDTVQMPVNIMDAHFDSFQHTIFPIARRQGTAVLAMKTFGDHFILDANVASPIEMLHFSMSQPVSVVITGVDREEVLQQALQAVRTYAPMTEQQQKELLARSAAAAQDGKTERYKVSHHFDGTVQNPGWLTEG
jgi:aryl-alcohol dehydrogenase-like predicted oxidoreductase